MKRIIIAAFIGLICSVNLFSAERPLPDPIQNPEVHYRLFQTSNGGEFIKLDTITGKMWKVKLDFLNGFYVHELNSIDISAKYHKEAKIGRYTMYNATQGGYYWFLLDQIDGDIFLVTELGEISVQIDSIKN